jgi:hypothetical protein
VAYCFRHQGQVEVGINIVGDPDLETKRANIRMLPEVWSADTAEATAAGSICL